MRGKEERIDCELEDKEAIDALVCAHALLSLREG
jgi:hypothetical protein